VSRSAGSWFSCMKRSLVLVISEVGFQFRMRHFGFSDFFSLIFLFLCVSSFARGSEMKWEGERVVRDVGQMAAVVR